MIFVERVGGSACSLYTCYRLLATGYSTVQHYISSTFSHISQRSCVYLPIKAEAADYRLPVAYANYGKYFPI